jgi:predicted Zn finger-like uncharacterized protein
MDVRCEKCSTVYEFDDSRVGEQGVTVKCTQCGNLFKVKRRGQTAENSMGAAAARSPAYIGPTRTPHPEEPGTRPPMQPPPMQPPRETFQPPRERTPTPVREAMPTTRERAATPAPRERTATPPPRTTSPGIPVLGKTPPSPARPGASAGHAPTIPAEGQRIPTPARGVETGWMIRMAATGDVFRFRELTTLQQWIVERKVTRDDEISRGGESWKRLGGIAELESFFHIVEQAEAVARADGPRAAAAAAAAAYQQRGVASPQEDGDDDPALSTTAPMSMSPSGPTALGNLMHTDEPAFARGRSQSSGMRALPEPPSIDDDDDDFDKPRRKRGGLVAGMFALGVVVAGGVYLGMFKRDAVTSLFAHGNARAEEAYRQGREYFLLDSDDNFRQAVTAFERAHGDNEKWALPPAGVAEAKAAWASYLNDDAKAIEAATPSPNAATPAATAAKTLRRDAQAALDDGKRAANDALDRDPDAAESNRAMAAILTASGAPAADVDRYLSRATQKRAADAECAYVAGALAYRDGKLEEAKAKLQQANSLNQAATQHVLLRASYLLARILVATNDKDGARRELQAVLAANAQHDRARALLATLEPATSPSGVAVAPSGAATAPSGATTAPSGVAVAPSGAATAPSGAAASPTGAKVVAAEKGGDKSAAGGGGDYAHLVAQADKLSENGRAAQARKLYEKALQQVPNGLEAMTGLGYCDLDGEEFSSAVDHFKQALSISPGNGEAIIGLAEAYKLRGDKQQAIEWYKKYLTMLPGGPKATMARNNVRDLEPQKREVETTTAPAPPDTKAEPKADDKPVPLPRLPTNDEPPP